MSALQARRSELNYLSTLLWGITIWSNTERDISSYIKMLISRFEVEHLAEGAHLARGRRGRVTATGKLLNRDDATSKVLIPTIAIEHLAADAPGHRQSISIVGALSKMLNGAPSKHLAYLQSHLRPISEGGGALCSLGHCFISAPHPLPRTYHDATTGHAAVWGSSDDPQSPNIPACVRSAVRARRFISRDDAHPYALALYGRSSRSLRHFISRCASHHARVHHLHFKNSANGWPFTVTK